MPQKPQSSKHSNDNHGSISPVDELHFIDALMADQELPMTARVVGYRLVRWTNAKKDHRFNGYTWASREKLGDLIGRKSEVTITTATNALKARGWIVTKRRPNATNLVRPNWDRASQATREDQKTVFPEDQLSVDPDVQKTGPYSADLHSTDLHSADLESFPNASRRECQTPRLEGPPAADTGIGNNNKPAAGYKQTKAIAMQVFTDLENLWPEASDDAEHQPGSRSERGASVNYFAHLKNGMVANRIKLEALKYLDTLPKGQWPCSLAAFLSGRIDPDQRDLYVPLDDDQPMTTNDNRLPARKASGDWDSDTPF